MTTATATATVPASSASVAPLVGRHIRLEPLTPAHYDWLYRLATSDTQGARWRLRGATPRPEQFVDFLWDGVLAQFVVDALEPHPGPPIGVLQCCDPNMRNQHASLSVLFDEEHLGAGWPLEGALLFVNYLFEHWPLRKLYLEGLEFNLAPLLSGSRDLLVEEGRFRSHEYFQGAWYDWITFALYREAFAVHGAPLVPRTRPGHDAGP